MRARAFELAPGFRGAGAVGDSCRQSPIGDRDRGLGSLISSPMSGEAEKLLTEIRDLCAEMLAETRAEAERQADLRAQYQDAVAAQRRFQRFAIVVIFGILCAVALYLYR